MMLSLTTFSNTIYTALKLLQQSENHCNKNLYRINELRKTIVNNYYKS